jgi:hypothetical protein
MKRTTLWACRAGMVASAAGVLVSTLRLAAGEGDLTSPVFFALAGATFWWFKGVVSEW